MPVRDEVDRFERYRSSRIWRSLDRDHRTAAAAALWESDQAGAEEIDAAVKAIAEALRFRPHSIRSAPAAKRTAYLAGCATLPDQVASSLLYVYHLTHQIPMMSRFLEALGIEHEKGRIADEVAPPERARLEQGIDVLLAEFERSDAVLYLKTLVSQDPETWGAVADLLEERGLDRPEEPA